MDHFDLTYVPSATVFYYLRANHPTSTNDSARYQLDYLGFSYLVTERGSQGELGNEVQACAAKFSQSHFKANAKEADLYQLSDSLRTVRYLHIVAHNLEVPGQSDDSYLAFGGGNGEDGRLTSDEIVNRLRNRPELAILSACQTAPAGEGFEPGATILVEIELNGDPEPLVLGSNCVCSYGESFSNLSGSFFASGSQGLLLTQWQIPNRRSTGQFIEQFFDYLRQGKPPAEALGMTKANTRSGRPPVSWAGFILAGD